MNMRRALLATVSGIAIGVSGGIGGIALLHKAEASTGVEYTLGNPAFTTVTATADGLALGSTQQNNVNTIVTATITGSGQSQVAPISGSHSAVIEDNQYIVSLQGNISAPLVDLDNMVDLYPTAVDIEDYAAGTMVAAVRAQLNQESTFTGTATGISHIQDFSALNPLAGITGGSVAIERNLVEVLGTLNDATTTLAGAVHLGQASAVAGAASVGISGALAAGSIFDTDTAGSLTIGSTQINDSLDVTVGASGILFDQALETHSTVNDTLFTGAASVSDNTVLVGLVGSIGDSTIDIQPGGNTRFQGSATIGSLQTTRASALSPTTSDVAFTSEVYMGTRGDGNNQFGNLSGSIAVDGNQVRTSVVAHDARNALSSGVVEFDGQTMVQANSLFGQDAATTQSVQADLGILNVQRIADSAVSASTGGVMVQAIAGQMQGGQVSVDGNLVTTDATGNVAGNVTALTGVEADAILATGSLQRIESSSPISASTGSVVFQARLGEGDTQSRGFLGGAASVDGNVAVSTARGNRSASQISVSGVELDTTQAGSTGQVGVAATNWTTDLVSTAAGGITVNSVQQSLGSVDALMSGATAQLVQNPKQQLDFSSGFFDASVSVDENLFAAQVFVNSTSLGNSLSGNRIDLDGVELTGSAALSSTQVAGATGVSHTGTAVLLEGYARYMRDFQASVSDNEILGRIRVNDAVNAITASQVAATGDELDGGSVGASAAADAFSAGADFALGNAQQILGPVTMGVTDASATLNIGSAAAGTGSLEQFFNDIRATVAGNLVSGETEGNVAANLIDLGMVSMAPDAGDPATQAALANVQVGQVMSSTVQGSAALNAGMVDNDVLATLLNLSVVENGFVSSLSGNFATNTVRGDIGALTIGPAVGSATTTGGVADGDAALTLTNYQGLGALSSTSTGSSTLSLDGGASLNVTASNIAVDDNAVESALTGNTAVNLIDLDVIGLAAGNNPLAIGALASIQTATGLSSDATGTFAGTVTGNDFSTVIMSTSGNEIDAFARANFVDNRIDFSAVGMTGGTLVIGSAETALSAAANASLALASEQTFTSVSSNVMPSSASATIGTVGEASVFNTVDVGVTANAAAATALGNIGINSLGLGTDEPAVSVSNVTLALASEQLGVDVSASSEASMAANIGMTAGSITDSKITVADNSISSYAEGNRVDNDIEIDSVSLSYSSVTPGQANIDPNVAAGDLALSSRQVMIGTVLANATAPDIHISGIDGAVTNSALSVTGNEVVASANSNVGFNSNDVDVSAVSVVDASIALLSQQIAGSTVATASAPNIRANVGTGPVTDSRVTLEDNSAIAYARGNQIDNAITIDATNLSMSDFNTAGTTTDGAVPVASATYALASDQIAGPTQATVAAFDVGSVIVGTTTGSQLSVSENTAIAEGHGNQGDNAITLSVGTMTGATAGLASVQQVTGLVSGSIISPTLAIVNDGDVGQSSVTLDGNASIARARANDVDNAVLVSVNSVNQMSQDDIVAVDFDGFVSSGGIALTSMQLVQAGAAADVLGSSVTATVDGAVTGSDVSVGGNVVIADAVGNRAGTFGSPVPGNAVTIEGGNLQDVTGVLASRQESAGAAISGTASGTTAFAISTGAVTSSALSADANVVSAGAAANQVVNALGVTGNNISATTSPNIFLSVDHLPIGISGAEYVLNNVQLRSNAVTATVANAVTSITADGAVEVGQLSVDGNQAIAEASGSRAANTVAVSGNQVVTTAGLANYQRGEGDPITASVTASDSITVNGSVLTGDLSASGNDMVAIASSNRAANVLEASATSLSSDGIALAFGTTDLADNVTPDTFTGSAALGISNWQGNASSVSASTSGSVAIDVNTGALTGTSVTASGNDIWAEASANTASNLASLDAVSSSVSSIVASSQMNTGSVSALLTTPTVSVTQTGLGTSGSAIALEGNRMVARSTGNNATNQQMATGGLTTPAGVATSAVTGGSSASATGGYAVLNRQTNAGNVITSTITGPGGVTAAFQGMSSGSVTVSNNLALSEATGNRAGNSLELNGQPNVTASAAVTNYQSNSSVTISATIDGMTHGINGAGGATTGSSFVNRGNVVMARATGNAASNSNITRGRTLGTLGY